MKNFATGFFLLFMYLGASFIYPILTFIIVMNKWAEWIDIEMKELFNKLYK